MSMTVTLRVIDCSRLFVMGRKVAKDAADQNDPELLRRYLSSLPLSVDLVAVRTRGRRLRRLRELKAPEIILKNEERMFREIRRKQCVPESLANASLAELSELLNDVCSWGHEIGDGLRRVVNPRNERRYLGAARNTVLIALHGSEEHPLRADAGYGDFAYNPPDVVRELSAELASIEFESLTRRASELPDREEILDRARQEFGLLRGVYWFASKRDAGVASECW